MIYQCSPSTKTQYILPLSCRAPEILSPSVPRNLSSDLERRLHCVLVSLNFLLLNLLRENQCYKKHIPSSSRSSLLEVHDHTEHIIFIYGYEMHYSEWFPTIMASDLTMVFQEGYFFMKAYKMFRFHENKNALLSTDLFLKHCKTVYLRVPRNCFKKLSKCPIKMPVKAFPLLIPMVFSCGEVGLEVFK